MKYLSWFIFIFSFPAITWFIYHSEDKGNTILACLWVLNSTAVGMTLWYKRICDSYSQQLKICREMLSEALDIITGKSI